MSDSEANSSVLQPHPGKIWCALHTRARHEKKIVGICTSLKLPSYLPLYIHRTFSGGKTNTFHLPMFPGYVFAALGPGDITNLKRTNSVAHRIDAPDETRFLADLQNVYRAENSQMELELNPLLQKGQPVVVIRGPLSGTQGVVVRYKNRTRLQISVTLIRQAILLDIHQDDLASA